MVKKLQALRAKKGFTLVELIVVIAIIGVLAAILVPVMMGQVTKSKVNSLDSTAKTVVTTVNTWIADRYSNGESGGISTEDDGYTAYVVVGGTVDGASGSTKWGIKSAESEETSLTHALKEAYNFAADDVVKFWIDKSGKCVAAVFVQSAAKSDVGSVDYNGSWSGVVVTNKKDGIVNIGTSTTVGKMVGTNPKLKSST